MGGGCDIDDIVTDDRSRSRRRLLVWGNEAPLFGAIDLLSPPFMAFATHFWRAVACFFNGRALVPRRLLWFSADAAHGQIRYCSIHQGGIFPGSGGAEDTGPLGGTKQHVEGLVYGLVVLLGCCCCSCCCCCCCYPPFPGIDLSPSLTYRITNAA